MTVSDPIADTLTRIRNAVQVRHHTVLAPASKFKVAIARILKEEGYIRDYELVRGPTPQRMLRIFLRYYDGQQPAITALRRVSKPGLRVYVGKGEVPRNYGGLGISIVSTSQGVKTGHEARRRGLGGELLCYIW